MTRRWKFLVTLAALHAMLVLCGASGIRLDSFGPVGELLTYYGVLSGAERGFGFFAPAVNTQARASFDIVDKQGLKFSRPLEQGTTSEAALRIGNIGSKFWGVLDGDNENLRNSITASWAGKMFALYPQAREITVNFEIYQLTTMEEYRKGKRPRWIKIYEAKYVHEG